FSPTGSESLTTESSTPIGSDQPPEQLQLATTLVPDVVGQWTVQAVATDSSGVATPQTLPIEVTTDQPPCLATWQPAAPPTTEPSRLAARPLFGVLFVATDFDPYPPVPNDSVFGTTTFAWSLLPPGASTREPLTSATGASTALDPASYQPGDVVELRVEIFDR